MHEVKPFKFKLQTPLDIAERQEQLAREELLACITERDKIQQELKWNVSRLERMKQLIREYTEKHSSLQRVLLIKEFIPVLTKLIINIEDRLNLAEQEVERARGVLLERTKETKTLNKLHEKEWQLYLQEWNREEQKLVDEIAITGHFRKSLS